MTPRRMVVPVGFALFLVVATLAGVAGGYATGVLLASSPEVAAPIVPADDGTPTTAPTTSIVSTTVKPAADPARQRCLVLKDFGPMLGKATSLVGSQDDAIETSLRRAVKEILPPTRQWIQEVKEIGAIADDKSNPRFPVLLAPYSTKTAGGRFMDDYQGGVAIYFQPPADLQMAPPPTTYGAVLLLIEPTASGSYTTATFLIAHVIQHGSGVCERL